ncbi:predicted protein [Thalassiosira pseudonana CCMP1335]|uniref:NB-ARC domain-containing protein n=1 Tax=Thalassiosira pseudonana TaxID=35128 RepID=B8C4W3_THAPS|nr:predicted protein [Thalassiosira pseudonana CCMP1335]EED91400.1 predicted protein [Thalassiosira pseudonana CCMP1335]
MRSPMTEVCGAIEAEAELPERNDILEREKSPPRNEASCAALCKQLQLKPQLASERPAIRSADDMVKHLIFPFLDSKDLLRIRPVCKLWSQSIPVEQQTVRSFPSCDTASMERRIGDFMLNVSSELCRENSSGFLYICGGSGSGKTCAKNVSSTVKHKFNCCFVNMASIHASMKYGTKVINLIIRKIAKELEIKELPCLESIEEVIKKKALVLVLDEIDLIFKKRGGNAKSWYQPLFALAKDNATRFGIIGISNSVNDTYATRIRDIGKPQVIVFTPYKEEDLIRILKQRVGNKIVMNKALELIAKRVAWSSGDARQALEITYNAIGKCLESLTDKQRSINVESDEISLPLVKLSHVMRAIREGNSMRHADLIKDLPQSAKVVLCIAVSLSQVWGSTAEVSVATLKKYCITASQHSIMDELDIDHIMNFVEMLCDAGLLVMGNDRSFNASDTGSRLKIGVQLEELETSLEETRVSPSI